ncbi:MULTISPECIES: YidB family protein [Paenalcaligenes]|uniref:YidB family protein n=1 Tax=Paenalcaligenes hermetiae TaxID=1157987 RepID=A0ABP9LV00_9BURK|nr:YidB family protein [Paenalcaligenes sp.]
MSLLNSVLANAASVMLRDKQKEQATLLPAFLQAVNQYPGGINGLLEAFKQGGLGAVVQSWMSQGENLPIAPTQLQQVLGNNMVTDLVSKTGLSQDSVLNHLSSLLPVVVDKLFSQNNKILNESGQVDMSQMMSTVLALLAKK